MDSSYTPKNLYARVRAIPTIDKKGVEKLYVPIVYLKEILICMRMIPPHFYAIVLHYTWVKHTALHVRFRDMHPINLYLCWPPVSVLPLCHFQTVLLISSATCCAPRYPPSALL